MILVFDNLRQNHGRAHAGTVCRSDASGQDDRKATVRYCSSRMVARSISFGAVTVTRVSTMRSLRNHLQVAGLVSRNESNISMRRPLLLLSPTMSSGYKKCAVRTRNDSERVVYWGGFMKLFSMRSAPSAILFLLACPESVVLGQQLPRVNGTVLAKADTNFVEVSRIPISGTKDPRGGCRVGWQIKGKRGDSGAERFSQWNFQTCQFVLARGFFRVRRHRYGRVPVRNHLDRTRPE